MSLLGKRGEDAEVRDQSVPEQQVSDAPVSEGPSGRRPLFGKKKETDPVLPAQEAPKDKPDTNPDENE